MTHVVASRMRQVEEAPTIAVEAKVGELRKRGVGIVDLGQGGPGFSTPRHIGRAAVDAIKAGITHYGPARGFPELRAAIAQKVERESSIKCDPGAEILATLGAKQALLEALLAIVSPSDEAIIFEPSWGSYAAIVQVAGGRPLRVDLCDDFTFDTDRLERRA